MRPSEAIKIIKGLIASVEFAYKANPLTDKEPHHATDALILAISALEKQEQSCETCKHGRFGDEACINCRVGFPNHYEGVEES